MDLQDVRRFAMTTMALFVVLVLWVFFLFLHDTGRFEWTWPEAALGWFSLGAWLWTSLGLSAVMVGFLGFMTFGINEAPPGYAKGKLRQVQCQDCKAVFFVLDAGNRPLTHVCPNCKALGVYDGRAPPVGAPPEAIAPEKLIKLALTCEDCSYKFRVTDTGRRPLQVTCPSCQGTGAIQ